jgi:superfamily II RNA helicase
MCSTISVISISLLKRFTERGKWLADLRVDRPLLLGEALDRGIFQDLEPKYLAGLVALFGGGQ